MIFDVPEDFLCNKQNILWVLDFSEKPHPITQSLGLGSSLSPEPQCLTLWPRWTNWACTWCQVVVQGLQVGRATFQRGLDWRRGWACALGASFVFKQLLDSQGLSSPSLSLYLGNYFRHQPRCTGHEIELTDAAKINMSIALLWLTLHFFL